MRRCTICCGRRRARPSGPRRARGKRPHRARHGQARRAASSITRAISTSSCFTTPTRAASLARDVLHGFFNRLARELVRILDERTGDGYVFRTDLRLRPDPALDAARRCRSTRRSVYYESAGQNWERAALIKARPVAGDRVAGQRVPRRAAALYLAQAPRFRGDRRHPFDQAPDRGASRRRRGSRSLGHDIKLGRGGIREIEFFAQTQQLIWGGRHAASCGSAATCEALAALAARGPNRRGRPRRADRRLPLPAPRRASAADGRRRADPPLAERCGRASPRSPCFSAIPSAEAFHRRR